MIHLSNSDLDFLLDILDSELTPALKDTINQAKHQQRTLTNEEAEELRELCLDWLSLHGFDEHYEPTEKGKRAENLIDKLFTS